MKRIVCEMCGSTDILKQDSVFVCQSCMTKYSVDEARKMMVEGTVEVVGTVKVDNSDKVSNYLMLGNDALESDRKKASDYSDRVIEIDPRNYKAWYLKACSNDIPNTGPKYYLRALEFCPKEELYEFLEELVDKICGDWPGMSYNQCIRFCEGLLKHISDEHLDKYLEKFINWSMDQFPGYRSNDVTECIYSFINEILIFRPGYDLSIVMTFIKRGIDEFSQCHDENMRILCDSIDKGLHYFEEDDLRRREVTGLILETYKKTLKIVFRYDIQFAIDSDYYASFEKMKMDNTQIAISTLEWLPQFLIKWKSNPEEFINITASYMLGLIKDVQLPFMECLSAVTSRSLPDQYDFNHLKACLQWVRSINAILFTDVLLRIDVLTYLIFISKHYMKVLGYIGSPWDREKCKKLIIESQQRIRELNSKNGCIESNPSNKSKNKKLRLF